MPVSGDYRNESRRFIPERGKTRELNIALQDLTPLLVFETPGNAKVFVDGVRLNNAAVPRTVETGTREVKIRVSDYTMIKTVFVRRGKTYRIAFKVDTDVAGED